MKLIKRILRNLLKILRVPTMNEFVANYEEYAKELARLGEKRTNE